MSTERAVGETWRVDWPDMMFAGVFTRKHSHSVDFSVFEVCAMAESEAGQFNDPLFLRAGAVDCGDIVSSPEEAEVFMRGHVKWDGCTNYEFPAPPCYHSCGLDDVVRIADVWRMIYAETAAALGATFNRELAGMEAM